MGERTLVTFRSSAFNTTEEHADFINPGTYGDDLARWLIVQLAERGFAADPDPGQEDFGWYIKTRIDNQRYCFVVGYRPGDQGEQGDWIVWIERDPGFLGSVLGGRSRGVRPAAMRALHTILSAAPEIGDIRWHERADFDAGKEELGAAQP